MISCCADASLIYIVHCYLILGQEINPKALIVSCVILHSHGIYKPALAQTTIFIFVLRFRCLAQGIAFRSVDAQNKNMKQVYL